MDTFRAFCGNDGVTYNTTNRQFTSGDCYSYCGVAVLYAGRCGCPNDCGADSGHGSCSVSNASALCVCTAGWGGPDCLSVRCPSNGCGGHGTCVSGVGAADYCRCEAGYTGTYCSEPVLRMPQPVGVFPNAPPLFSPAYAYGDLHPVFNVSVLATWDITMSPEDLLHVIDPFVVYNNNAVRNRPALLTFDNGVLRKENMTVTIQVKGTSSRLDMKKGFNVKFKGGTLADLSEIGLKTGNDGGDKADSPLKTFLTVTLGRAVSVPMTRTGWGLLTINRVFMGLYYYDEAPQASAFTEAFYGEPYVGDSVKLTHDQFLDYLGDNVSVYESLSETKFINFTSLCIDTDNMTVYVDLVRAMSLPTFEPQAMWVIQSVLGTLAVEAFLLANDNFVDGNNYYLYRARSDGLWRLIDHDFDAMFDGTGHGSHNVYVYITNYTDSGTARSNPVRRAVTAQPALVARFTEMMRGVLTSPLFGMSPAAVSASPRLPEVYSSVGAWVGAWVIRDKLQQLAFDASPAQFFGAVNTTSSALAARAAAVFAQLPSPQPPTSSSASCCSTALVATCSGVVAVLLVVAVAVAWRRRSRWSPLESQELSGVAKGVYTSDDVTGNPTMRKSEHMISSAM